MKNLLLLKIASLETVVSKLAIFFDKKIGVPKTVCQVTNTIASSAKLLVSRLLRIHSKAILYLKLVG